MNPSQKTYLPFLDGIRGIAILSVFLFHSLDAAFGFDQLRWSGIYRDFGVSRSFLVLYPFTYGSSGVAIFFVVSGFCIHLSHKRSKDKGWLLFANKRWFRIFPPYLLAMFIFSFVWPWGRLSLDKGKIDQIINHALAIHNYDNQYLFGINPSFWSIAVEIQLYAIYPLLIFMATRLGWRRTLLVAGAAEVSIRLSDSFNNPLPHYIAYSPMAFFLSWSLGAYLSECYMNNRTTRLFNNHFGLICFATLLIPLLRPTSPFTFLAFAWLAATAIERLMTEKWKLPTNNLFELAWSHLALLGVVSYSFYLFHQPIIKLTVPALLTFLPGFNIHPLLRYLACLLWYPVILLLSYLVFNFVEKPSIRLGHLVAAKINLPNNKKKKFWS